MTEIKATTATETGDCCCLYEFPNEKNILVVGYREWLIDLKTDGDLEEAIKKGTSIKVKWPKCEVLPPPRKLAKKDVQWTTEICVVKSFGDFKKMREHKKNLEKHGVLDVDRNGLKRKTSVNSVETIPEKRKTGDRTTATEKRNKTADLHTTEKPNTSNKSAASSSQQKLMSEIVHKKQNKTQPNKDDEARKANYERVFKKKKEDPRYYSSSSSEDDPTSRNIKRDILKAENKELKKENFRLKSMLKLTEDLPNVNNQLQATLDLSTQILRNMKKIESYSKVVIPSADIVKSIPSSNISKGLPSSDLKIPKDTPSTATSNVTPSSTKKDIFHDAHASVAHSGTPPIHPDVSHAMKSLPTDHSHGYDFSSCNHTRASKLINDCMVKIWGNATLAQSTRTGSGVKTYAGVQVSSEKQKLDDEKLQILKDYVYSVFPDTSIDTFNNTVSIKCSNEAKKRKTAELEAAAISAAAAIAAAAAAAAAAATTTTTTTTVSTAIITTTALTTTTAAAETTTTATATPALFAEKENTIETGASDEDEEEKIDLR
ncbi:uncharacterized protein LOC135837755 [Planococcus citri]|uniref:uncharacterized protein LOC135837755 n=1 Tax=Planococcus citri TaxID=170843 RepID=UPI0031FA27A8